MAFKKLEKGIKEEELCPVLRRAISIVRKKIPQIKDLVQEGYGPKYIKEMVFRGSVGYNTMMAAYEMITGERLVGSKHSKRHLSENCGFIDDLVCRLSESNEIYALKQGKLPGAVWKF